MRCAFLIKFVNRQIVQAASWLDVGPPHWFLLPPQLLDGYVWKQPRKYRTRAQLWWWGVWPESVSVLSSGSSFSWRMSSGCC